MRRLKEKLHQPESQRGAAGVLVAVMMLVLIGAGALAVDVGQIYAERAQLQNAADSGALAVVDSCDQITGCGQSAAPNRMFCERWPDSRLTRGCYSKVRIRPGFGMSTSKPWRRTPR